MKNIKQKAIIVKGDDDSELNDLLQKDWRVINTCPMPSSTSSSWTIKPQCLVILEKNND